MLNSIQNCFSVIVKATICLLSVAFASCIARRHWYLFSPLFGTTGYKGVSFPALWLASSLFKIFIGAVYVCASSPSQQHLVDFNILLTYLY